MLCYLLTLSHSEELTSIASYLKLNTDCLSGQKTHSSGTIWRVYILDASLINNSSALKKKSDIKSVGFLTIGESLHCKDSPIVKKSMTSTIRVTWRTTTA